jgi:hypothetical protein
VESAINVLCGILLYWCCCLLWVYVLFSNNASLSQVKMYLSSKIFRILDSNKHEFVGTRSTLDLKKNLQKLFKSFNLIVTIYNTEEDFEYILGASYDNESNKIEMNIFLYKDLVDFSLKEEEWRSFRFKISQILQHELIHREQHRKKVVDNGYFHSDEKSYLSNPDEIDAYSHDIAMEIVHFYGETQKYEIIRNISNKNEVASYKIYENIFKDSNWESIRRKLIKKTYLWLDYVTIR